MTDDDLLRALRDAARADQRDPLPTPAAPSDARIDELTALCLAELKGATPAREPAPARAIPLRKPRFVGAAAVVLAAAAALLVMLRPEATPLPPYRLELTLGSEQSVRGSAPSEAIVYRPGAPFALTLRPQTSLSAALDARAIWVDGTTAHALPITLDTTARGTVHVQGTLPDERPSSGARLFVCVGRSGSLPSPQAFVTEPPASSPEFQVLSVEIRGLTP